MELNLSSWQSFSDICITKKNLNCQYADIDRAYRLLGPDANAITWVYDMPKKLADGTDNPEVALFLVAAPAFNWAVGARSYSFAAPDYMFAGDGVDGVCTAGGTLDLDYMVNPANSIGQNINGGLVIIKGGNHGDWIECMVKDVGNFLPAPYTGATLNTWVKKWFVPENGEAELETPYAGRIPAGMYLRCTYHSTGATDVKVAMNYFLHTPI